MTMFLYLYLIKEVGDVRIYLRRLLFYTMRVSGKQLHEMESDNEGCEVTLVGIADPKYEDDEIVLQYQEEY